MGRPRKSLLALLVLSLALLLWRSTEFEPDITSEPLQDARRTGDPPAQGMPSSARPDPAADPPAPPDERGYPIHCKLPEPTSTTQQGEIWDETTQTYRQGIWVRGEDVEFYWPQNQGNAILTIPGEGRWKLIWRDDHCNTEPESCLVTITGEVAIPNGALLSGVLVASSCSTSTFSDPDGQFAIDIPIGHAQAVRACSIWTRRGFKRNMKEGPPQTLQLRCDGPIDGLVLVAPSITAADLLDLDDSSRACRQAAFIRQLSENAADNNGDTSEPFEWATPTPDQWNRLEWQRLAKLLPDCAAPPPPEQGRAWLNWLNGVGETPPP